MTGEYQPVLELTRGRIVESLHFGAAAVVESDGRLVAWLGDPQLVTYMRSSAKPLQALPFIERGGDQTYHLTSREIAVICSSHDGMDEHVEVVKGIQAKVGIRESDLLCGTHRSVPRAYAGSYDQGRGSSPPRTGTIAPASIPACWPTHACAACPSPIM